MEDELDARFKFIILKEAIPLDLQYLNEATANKDFRMTIVQSKTILTQETKSGRF
jgi:hypothetical protein